MLIKNNLFCSFSDPQVLSTIEALIRMLARIILLGEKNLCFNNSSGWHNSSGWTKTCVLIILIIPYKKQATFNKESMKTIYCAVIV